MANRNVDSFFGRLIAWPILGVVLGIVSCGDSATNKPPPTSTTTPTWNDDIGPMMQTHCGGCHNPKGSGHFDLLHYDNVKPLAPSASTAMTSGRMPPWPPASDCREYLGDRTLPAGLLEKFDAWVAGGMPVGEGEAKSFSPRQFNKLRADVTAKMAEAYTPNVSLTDDYRCFILDAEFPTETYVEGVDVTPGSLQVHHVLTYAIGGDELATAIKADTDEAGAGYTCFGGPNPSGKTTPGFVDTASLALQVGGWVPGFQAEAYPSGSAMRVPAGSRLVMQVHYNLSNGSPAPDQTSMIMQTRATAPALLYHTVPVAQPRLNIKAGDTASTQSVTIQNWSASPTTLVTVAGHMHTLGTSIRGTILHTSNKEECLLDIPEWDFNWQMLYRLAPTNYAMVQPGDSLKLECVYDNSAANQPVVGGVKQPPKDVKWGEGTLDEMCLMYLGVLTPFEPAQPPPATACEKAAPCIQACNPQSTSCLMDCKDVNLECVSCTFNGLLSCGALQCGPSIQVAQQCVLNCAMGVNTFGGSIQDCVLGTCPNEWKAVTTCLDPFLAAPNCAAPLAACGI